MQLEKVKGSDRGVRIVLNESHPRLFPNITWDDVLFLYDYKPGSALVVSTLRYPLVRGGGPSWSLPCKTVPASLCPSDHHWTLKFWPNEMTGRSGCVQTRVSSWHDPFDIYLVGAKAYFTHGTVSNFHGAGNRFQPSFASTQRVADFSVFLYDVHDVIIHLLNYFYLSLTIIYCKKTVRRNRSTPQIIHKKVHNSFS